MVARSPATLLTLLAPPQSTIRIRVRKFLKREGEIFFRLRVLVEIVFSLKSCTTFENSSSTFLSLNYLLHIRKRKRCKEGGRAPYNLISLIICRLIAGGRSVRSMSENPVKSLKALYRLLYDKYIPYYI